MACELKSIKYGVLIYNLLEPIFYKFENTVARHTVKRALQSIFRAVNERRKYQSSIFKSSFVARATIHIPQISIDGGNIDLLASTGLHSIYVSTWT